MQGRKKNKQIISQIILGLSLFSASILSAHEPSPKPKHPPWTGTNLALGIVNNTGNTNQTDFNLGGNLQYEKDRWKNIFNAQAQLTVAQEIINKEQINANEQLNYGLGESERNYLYGASIFSYNRFAPYEYQSTTGAGYGYQLIVRKPVKWSLQAGPALRYDRLPTEASGKKHIITQIGSNFSWDILENLKLGEIIRYDIGHPYDYLNAITTFNTRLVGHWSLLLTYAIEYYSMIPRGSTYTRKLDTTTSLALAYNL